MELNVDLVCKHFVMWEGSIQYHSYTFQLGGGTGFPDGRKIIGASVSEPPLVDSTDTLSRYIYIYTSGTSVLRMRGATRKRSRPDRESSQSS